MALGLSPKIIQDLPLDQLSPEHFLVLAIEAAKQLDWKLGYIHEKGFIAYTPVSKGSAGEVVKVKIQGDQANLMSECAGNQLVDWGKNKENIDLFVRTFYALKGSFSQEEIDEKHIELKLTPKGQEQLRPAAANTKKQLGGFLALFKPTEGYFITPVLVNLNILLFVFMVISGVNFLLPDNDSLIKWGANFRPMTLDGEAWRLLTSCFLHIGLVHLLLNMYALIFIGLLLEPHLGKTKFILAYLLSGICASATSLWWHDLTISAGASGAIFGMYGVFLALLTTNYLEKTARKELLASIGLFVAYNLMTGLKGGVDNAAHIGGLVSGIVLGYALLPSLKKPEDSSLGIATLSSLTLLVLVSCFFVYSRIPNEIGKYDKGMLEFSSREEIALQVYNMPENTPTAHLLYGLQQNGIVNWKKNIALIDSLDVLELPDEIHERNRLLKEYCELRIKSYELLYKAIAEDTDQYSQEIDAYHADIEQLISDMDGEAKIEE